MGILYLGYEGSLLDFLHLKSKTKRGGKKRIKILYATQVDIKPPKIMLFTNGNLESSYIRYIEKCIRLEYQFVGVPIHIVVKVKNEES